MDTINAVIIDDEPKAIAILENKLKRHCSQVQIIATTQSPLEGIALINKLEPQLVFLDISMPEMTGFQMLQQIPEPNFEVIFATAFDQYAIQAIKHSAIGYLVKPIDNEDLIIAVNTATKEISNRTALKKNKILIENLGVQKFQNKKVAIPATAGIEFIKIDLITHCEGVDGYTKIHFTDRKAILSSSSIGHFVRLLDHDDFYQIHKSYLVNLNHLERYLNDGYAELTGGHSLPVSRNKRAEFLMRLKN